MRNISKCVPEKHHLTLYIKSPLDPRKTDMSFKLSSLAKCIIVHSFILYLHLCFIPLSSNFILAMKCHTKHTIYSQEKQKYNTGATKATNVIEKKYINVIPAIQKLLLITILREKYMKSIVFCLTD